MDNEIGFSSLSTTVKIVIGIIAVVAVVGVIALIIAIIALSNKNSETSGTNGGNGGGTGGNGGGTGDGSSEPEVLVWPVQISGPFTEPPKMNFTFVRTGNSVTVWLPNFKQQVDQSSTMFVTGTDETLPMPPARWLPKVLEGTTSFVINIIYEDDRLTHGYLKLNASDWTIQRNTGSDPNRPTYWDTPDGIVGIVNNYVTYYVDSQ